MVDEITTRERIERAAMLGNKRAGLVVVGVLRTYREAVAVLLRERYRDGEVDAVALRRFANAIDDAETAFDNETWAD